MTDHWNTIGKQNPQTDSVHDHLVNCQAERELSSLLRNTAEFRKKVTCPACAAICSPESRGFPGPRDLFYSRQWAFKFSLVGPGRGCGSQVAQTSRLQEGRGTKKGEDGKHNYFLADSASPWFMEVAWFLFLRWGLRFWWMQCTLHGSQMRKRPRGLKPPTPSRQIQLGHLPASSLSWLIWFQLHLTRLNPLIANHISSSQMRILTTRGKPADLQSCNGLRLWIQLNHLSLWNMLPMILSSRSVNISTRYVPLADVKVSDAHEGSLHFVVSCPYTHDSCC